MIKKYLLYGKSKIVTVHMVSTNVITNSKIP